MKRQFFNITIVFFALFVFFFFSCSYGVDEFLYRDGVVNKRADSLLDLSESQAPIVPSNENYSFYIITDVHFCGENKLKTGSRKDQQFIDKIASLPQDKRPYFIVSLGDVAEHGRSGEYKDYKAFTDKIALIKNPLGNPIRTFNVVGNHDLYNSGWDYYKDYAFPGTSFYRFKTSGLSWYFIDTGSGSLGKNQFKKLKNAMKSDPNPKFIFTHFPIYADGFFYFCMQNTMERNLLISLCAKTKVLRFFSGHTHEHCTSDMGKFTENNIPGYLEDRSWASVTVNESTKKIDVSIMSL